MKKFTSKSLVALIMMCSVNMFSGQMRPHMLFAAKMDGAQEIPSVSGTGSGVASILLNPARDTMCINVTFSGLTGAPVGAHIHSGAAGVNGGVVVDLTPYITGNKLVATLTGSVVSASLKSSMLKGLNYINIHTAANPNGEIRGQIWLESDQAFVGAMDGAQETPSVSTMANGYAVFNVAKHQGTVNFFVVTNGLSGPIAGAHIHAGATGTTGGIIQDLTMFVNGNNSLTGAFTPSANVISNLMAGTAYINIHTSANPNGEIRGQLKMDDKIAFDAWMDGAQESPTVATNAIGLTSLRLNTTLDSLWYNVYTDGLSGPITSAHIHNGAPGISGGVAVAFGTATGNMISGVITGTALNTTLINNILSGMTYANVHTTLNPAGEIRGQIYRVMREGYTFSMDGNQENPAVTTSAMGSGIVSVNREMDNAHYMIASNGITPVGMHFHKGAMGINGSVINNITSVYSNNMASGYWKTTDTSPFSPFSSIIANQIDNDSIYVNMHTTANPNGEIRGQVFSGFKCYSISTGITAVKVSPENEIVVYPNPTADNFNVSVTSAKDGDVNIRVYDLMGKLTNETVFKIVVGKNNFLVDMNHSPKGIYFVKINNGKEELIQKLIVE